MSQLKAPPTDWKGTLRYLGPGLIITASIVGSGELIATPAVASDPGIGFKLLWFIILGCVIKVFVQLELGRYAISRGKTTIEAMDEMPGPRWRVSWLVWIWLFMFIALPFQVAGMFGAIAKMVTLGGGPKNLEWLWVVCIGVGTSVLLVSGRYRLVQNASTVMVVLFTFFTLFALVTVQTTDFAITGANIAEGLSFQMPPNFTVAFAAFGIIGVGASELIYYPFWCLEKGYATNVGKFDKSEEWYARARGWVRVMSSDAWLSMVVYTGATVAFYLLGAAVLHGQGIVIKDGVDQGGRDVIYHLSRMYTDSYGNAGLLIFLMGGACVLFSTVFAATASNSRLLINGLSVYKLKAARDEEEQVKLVKMGCVFLALFSMAIALYSNKVVLLVLIGGVAQGIMLPFLAAAALYFRFQHKKLATPPGKEWKFGLGTFFLVVSLLAMSAVGIYQAQKEIRGAVKKPEPIAAPATPGAAPDSPAK